MFLLSTSPGKRGGASVLANAGATFPHLGGNLVARFSLPSFGETFDPEKGITDAELASKFEEQLTSFRAALG
jgi:hypothetical protein